MSQRTPHSGNTPRRAHNTAHGRAAYNRRSGYSGTSRRKRPLPRRILRNRLIAAGMLAALVAGVVIWAVVRANAPADLGKAAVPDWVDVQLIGEEGTARRGDTLSGVRDIVVHYVGNPGTTAQQNRDYFDTPGTEVCSHFVVGLSGEVIQCVPLDEISSASNWRNKDTISIETCHPDDTGVFNDETYQSLVKLTAWLCKESRLSAEHVIRHYDVTGKECPRWFVQDEGAWEQFKADVDAAIKEG